MDTASVNPGGSTQQAQPNVPAGFYVYRQGPDYWTVNLAGRWVSSHKTEADAQAFAKLKNEE